MTANYYENIYECLRQQPNKQLIVWPDATAYGQSFTAGNILDRVTGIQHELANKQIKPGQKLLLVMPVSFELICTLLAIMAIGAIPVLPPASLSWKTVLFLATRGNLTACITSDRFPIRFLELIKLVGIRLLTLNTAAETKLAWPPPQPVDPNQPALISHSSGSTGTPKQIRRSHRVLLAQHQALKQAFPPWANQRDFPLFPNILLHNLAVGTVSILPDLPGFKLTHMEPDRIVQQLIHQRIQTLTGNVYYFQRLVHYLNAHPQTFTDVRAVGIGGSPVPETLVHALIPFFVVADIYIIYGSSEAEPIAIRKANAETQNPVRGYAVGQIHQGITVNIRPIGTIRLPDEATYEVGEIEVKGDHVASESGNWLPTGDFGYIDDTNSLVLTGRKGNEQLHQGVQHYQVEHVLAHVPGVTQVAARSTEQGFSVYVAGQPNEAEIWQPLELNFPKGIINHVNFRRNLPVDTRHQSKIKYDQLS